MPTDEAAAAGAARQDSLCALTERTLILRSVSPGSESQGDPPHEKRVHGDTETFKLSSKAPSSRDASKTASFKRPILSRGASSRPEQSYEPNGDAHVEAARIGSFTQKLDKKLSKGKLGGKSFRSNANEKAETPEETERIRSMSKAIAQQAIFKEQDMKVSLRELAVEAASEAVVRGGWDNEIAAFIKKRMDKRQQSITGGRWHCIVGPDFGSYVTHERGCFCYFYLRRELSPVEAVEKARCERKQRQEQLAISGAADEEAEQEDTVDSEVVEERRMIGILLWRT